MKEEEKQLVEVKNSLMLLLDDYLRISFDELMAKYNCKHKGD